MTPAECEKIVVTQVAGMSGAAVCPLPCPGHRLPSRLDNTKPRRSGAFARLRGKDSNLDYLIQSQASYH